MTVVSIPYLWQVFAPDGLIMRGDTAEGGFQIFVDALRLAVALWVEAGGEADLGSYGRAKLFHTRHMN